MVEMAEFEFKCPQCGQTIEADDSLCGQVAECPHCGKGIVVPNIENTPRPSSHLRPIDREKLRRPAQNSNTPRHVSEFERMAQAEAKRRRAEKTFNLLKNVVLLLVMVAVVYGAWSVLKGNSFLSAADQENAEKAESPAASDLERATTESGERDGQVSSTKMGERIVPLESSKDKVVVIGNEGKGGGTGFLAKMDGKTYLVTNEHVARATDEFRRIYLLDGTRLELGAFEVAEGRDIVRFEVQNGLPTFELSETTPSINEKIVIYGNSAGKGAITEELGEIKAVGTFRLEVVARVVAGNSGSPVVNSRGEVVGVYTYVTRGDSSKDFDMLDSRYKDGRKWAVRFTGVKWVKIDWAEYCRQVALLEDTKEFLTRLMPFLAEQEGVANRHFSYGLRYDELTRLGFHSDDDTYRMHLQNLSKTYNRWHKVRSDFERSLKTDSAKDLDENRTRWQESEKDFAETLAKALQFVAISCEKVKWGTMRMKDEVDTCQEWIGEQFAIQKRRLKNVGEIMKEIGNIVKEEARGSLFDRTKNCMAIVNTGDGAGSGFLVKMDGRIRFITNEHVARGGNPFSATLPNGTALRFEPTIEVAANRDLVRMTVIGTNDVLEMATEEPKENQKIHVFGNSDGGGVLTSLRGTINGVGPDRIETQIPFVQGNSGSAILDESGKVLGVVTYATYYKDPDNWLKVGTRFDGIRRYGYRLNNVKWESISWNDYASRATALAECARYVELCRTICFRTQRLLHKYEIQELIEKGNLKQQALRAALLAIARADEAYLANQKEWNRLIKLMGEVKEYAMNDPRPKIKRNYREFPAVMKACQTARLNALKTGLNFVEGIDWKISRLKKIDERHGSVDAELFRWFFDVNIRRFREYFKAELHGLTMPELPQSLKKRL